MIEREMTREMQSSFQISVAEWRILASICTSGPASAADVAASYEADPGQTSRAVADLMRTGLIERAKSAGGGKKRTISPTDRGREIFAEIHKRRQAYFGKVMRDLSSEDVAVLDSFLDLIARRVDEERATACDP